MTVLQVRHTTIYRYRRPVQLGDHRLMLRPRDSHDLRLIETGLTFSPPASVRWVHDVFGNSIAIASFAVSAAELIIESSLTLKTYAVERPAFQIAASAMRYPFIYSPDDRIDLGGCWNTTIPTPKVGLSPGLPAWFAATQGADWPAGRLSAGHAARISYHSREAEGTQTSTRRSIAAGGRGAGFPCC